MTGKAETPMPTGAHLIQQVLLLTHDVICALASTQHGPGAAGSGQQAGCQQSGCAPQAAGHQLADVGVHGCIGGEAGGVCLHLTCRPASAT